MQIPLMLSWLWFNILQMPYVDIILLHFWNVHGPTDHPRPLVQLIHKSNEPQWKPPKIPSLYSPFYNVQPHSQKMHCLSLPPPLHSCAALWTPSTWSQHLPHPSPKICQFTARLVWWLIWVSHGGGEKRRGGNDIAISPTCLKSLVVYAADAHWEGWWGKQRWGWGNWFWDGGWDKCGEHSQYGHFVVAVAAFVCQQQWLDHETHFFGDHCHCHHYCHCCWSFSHVSTRGKGQSSKRCQTANEK